MRTQHTTASERDFHFTRSDTGDIYTTFRPDQLRRVNAKRGPGKQQTRRAPWEVETENDESDNTTHNSERTRLSISELSFSEQSAGADVREAVTARGEPYDKGSCDGNPNERVSLSGTGCRRVLPLHGGDWGLEAHQAESA